MDRGDGYETASGQRYSIPRKPTPSSPYSHPSYFNGGGDPYRSSRTESGYPPHRDDPSFSAETVPPTASSEATLREYPEPYHSNLPPSSVPLIDPKQQDLTRDPLNPNGTVINRPFRRHLLTWCLAFLAVCCFVFTTIYAWNATRGEYANTRLLFADPGRTILVLQVLTNVTTALFSELLRWALAIHGTKFTTFMGLSRATALYGKLYLFFSWYAHGTTKLWIFQRLILYAIVFVSSFILLTDLTIPTSYPVLLHIANGSSGMGDFGSTNPTYSIPAFHFNRFLQDTTSAIGLPPTCSDADCLSYYLPGGLDGVNNTCYYVTLGASENMIQLCQMMESGGMGLSGLGNMAGVISMMGGGNDSTLLNNVLSGDGGDIGGLSGLLGGSDGSGNSSGLLDGLLGGDGANLTSELSDLGGSGNDSSLLDGLLGGNNSSSLSDLLGGLKPRDDSTSKAALLKRQAAASFGNLTSGLQQAMNNAINWTAYAANQSSVFGTTDLAYVTYNAKGYRLDFSPYTGAFPENNVICGNWSASFAMQIDLVACIATPTSDVNSSTIIGGIGLCDEFGLFGQACTSAPGVRSIQYIIRMDISKMYATTAYALSNSSILSVTDPGEPTSYPINVTQFFEAFTSPFEQSQLIKLLEIGNPGGAPNIAPLVILALIGDFGYGGTGPSDGAFQLRNLMSVAFQYASLAPTEEDNTGPQAVTKISYTIHIAPATLYTYIVLGSLTLLWCLPVLIWSGMQLTPNTSGFPEVDFAAKWVSGPTIEGLSNVESKGVLKRLGGDMRLYLGEGVRDLGSSRENMIVLESGLPEGRLRRGIKYD